MKRRFISKKINKIKPINFVIIIFILIVISIIYVLSFINKRISPMFLEYAEIQTKNIVSLAISKTMTNDVISKMDTNNIFIITKNDNNEIESVSFNTSIVNQILEETNSVIQLSLSAIEKGDYEYKNFPEQLLHDINKEKLKKGIIYEIPMGIITKNAFLSNLGPKIPVKLQFIGVIESNIKTNIEQYGINNALIEIIIHISVTEVIYIPTTFKKVIVEKDIPVAVKMVQGKIPNYYSNYGNVSPLYTTDLKK